MIQTVLHPRLIEDKDWATLLFVLAFVLIAITKTAFEHRFNEYTKLIFSNKYLKLYRETSQIMSWFNFLLFVVQLISFSFFIQLTMAYFGYASKTDGVLYVRILTFTAVFILSKYLIEKIVATAFNIEEFAEQFNLQKLSYRTYIGMLILPVNLVLFYNNNQSNSLILAIIVTVLIINVLTYFVSLKNHQNLIFGKMFYFILYLCALEIAPYYFMYYWFTKS
jgi:hypothetical protein